MQEKNSKKFKKSSNFPEFGWVVNSLLSACPRAPHCCCPSTSSATPPSMDAPELDMLYNSVLTTLGARLSSWRPQGRRMAPTRLALTNELNGPIRLCRAQTHWLATPWCCNRAQANLLVMIMNSTGPFWAALCLELHRAVDFGWFWHWHFIQRKFSNVNFLYDFLSINVTNSVSTFGHAAALKMEKFSLKFWLIFYGLQSSLTAHAILRIKKKIILKSFNALNPCGTHPSGAASSSTRHSPRLDRKECLWHLKLENILHKIRQCANQAIRTWNGTTAGIGNCLRCRRIRSTGKSTNKFSPFFASSICLKRFAFARGLVKVVARHKGRASADNWKIEIKKKEKIQNYPMAGCKWNRLNLSKFEWI